MLRSYGDPPMFLEASGRWPPVVVGLHGWARDRNDFTRAFDGLDGAALDLPGFGMTPAPADGWDSHEYARVVRAFLRDLGRPVVLVGHSFGGRVAVRVAAAEPGLVDHLVLTGAPVARRESTGRRRRPAIAYRLVRRAHAAGLIGEERMEQARQRYGSADYAAARGVMRSVLVALLQEDYEDDLARLGVPVTLVWGEEDTEVPVEVARRAATIVDDCRVVVAPGAGHDLPWARPEVLRAAIEEAMA